MFLLFLFILVLFYASHVSPRLWLFVVFFYLHFFYSRFLCCYLFGGLFYIFIFPYGYFSFSHFELFCHIFISNFENFSFSNPVSFYPYFKLIYFLLFLSCYFVILFFLTVIILDTSNILNTLNALLLISFFSFMTTNFLYQYIVWIGNIYISHKIL